MKRNLQVEGMRGISILLVMIFHFFYRYLQVYSDVSLFRLPVISEFGTLGTSIFFVVSGYFMIKTKKRGLQFLKTRMLRLWPMYCIAITVIFIVTHIIELPGRTVSFADYLLNLFFINGFIGTAYVDGAHWFLCSIVGCTMVMTVLSRFQGKTRTWGLMVWIAVNGILAILISKTAGTVNTVLSICMKVIGGPRMPIVMLGMLFAIAETERERLLPVCGGLACVGIILFQYGKLFAVIVLFAAALVYAAFLEKIPFLSWKGFTKIGDASYAIYLIHQNIGFLIIYYVSGFIGQYRFWIAFVTMLLMTVVGVACHYAIEVRIQGLLAKRSSSKETA